MGLGIRPPMKNWRHIRECERTPRICLTRSDNEDPRRLAVNYLFMTNEGTNKHPELVLQPFDAKAERNDYEVRPHFC